MARKKKPGPCPECGEIHGTGTERLGHLLVAHAPAPRKPRRTARAMLPELGRRLEAAGFGELDAHRILRIVKEILREKGMV